MTLSTLFILLIDSNKFNIFFDFLKKPLELQICLHPYNYFHLIFRMFLIFLLKQVSANSSAL